MRASIAVMMMIGLACARHEAPSNGMKVASAAFVDDKEIPKQYTCDGGKTMPPLEFSGVPQSAKSLALIVTDPDAPSGTFTHLVSWNISPQTMAIDGGVMGKNDGGTAGWFAPCPPNGEHHYVFTLYALDAPLNLPAGSTRGDVERAMNGHTIAQAKLTGLYKR
jgi:Raf kinase inhibitor-like YbhB/YbcL family protein